MSKTQTIAKFAAVAAGFGLVASSFVAALPAAAQTTTMSASQVAALEAQIAALQAQLSSTQSTSASVTFTRDLTIGSTGSDVTALQTWLIAKGFSIPAGATGYFGAQTKAALAAYQAANGISPAAGYFGPITRANVNAAGGTTTTTTTTTTTGGTTTTTGTLSGSEGSINNFQTIGATTNTLGTGATQQVYGFQFMAGGSDLQVSRIYFDVVNPTANGTTRPWNVFQTASLTNGNGQTVATLDLTNQNNWSEDGTLANGNQIYRLDFENVNQIVKMNTTQSYYLTLTTQGAFASNNVVNGTYFNVGLANQGLRATDAMGLQQYSPSNTFSVSGNTVTGASQVNVNTNSTGSVVISTGSNTPQTQTVAANQNTVTQGIVLNTFTLQNTGSASVELYTLPVTVSTSTATLVNTVQDFKLYNGSTLLDTESPTQGGGATTTINFKNLNLVIPAGQTDSFSITADIQPIGGTNPAANGATVTVTVPATGSTVDIESNSGSIISPTGASTGYPISFAVNGLTVASNPTSATATVANVSQSATTQVGTFTFVFNVTAFGQNIYVPASNSAFDAKIFNQTTSTSSNLTNGAITSTANRVTGTGGAYYQVSSGQTATFTVTANQTGGANQFYYATLNDIKYGIDTNGTATSTVTLPSSYTTNAVAIQS